MFKQPNVGTLDRAARLILGALLIALPFLTTLGSTLTVALPVVGAVLVLTAFARFCPLYRLIGVSTCKVN
jgi:Inner membrane protein YgaP-like, transmembrane domain